MWLGVSLARGGLLMIDPGFQLGLIWNQLRGMHQGRYVRIFPRKFN